MLSNFGNGFKVFLLILVTSGALAKSYSDSGDFLGRLLSSKNGPVVVFLEPGNKNNDDDNDHNRVRLSHHGYDRHDRDSHDYDRHDYDRHDRDRHDRDRHDYDRHDRDRYEPEPGEEEAYMLYSVMRSAQETEDLDSEADKKFEKTKQLLRAAFAARCGKRAQCEEKCPKKEEKKGCEHNCQAVFDSLNACNDKPKPKDTCNEKKEEPKCGGKGKTMPPKWLLRMLRESNRD